MQISTYHNDCKGTGQENTIEYGEETSNNDNSVPRKQLI